MTMLESVLTERCLRKHRSVCQRLLS